MHIGSSLSLSCHLHVHGHPCGLFTLILPFYFLLYLPPLFLFLNYLKSVVNLHNSCNESMDCTDEFSLSTVGGGPGVCGIKGVLGPECKTCDRTQISSSQQVSGEVDTRFELFMALKSRAPEHCKNKKNVASCSLEFDELECENGGKRNWCEEAIVVGHGPVVDTLAQHWSPLNREMQHECADTSENEHSLSWAGHVAMLDYKEICAKALRCRGLQWWRWRQLHWKKWRRTKGLVRTQNDSKSSVGRTWCRHRSPSLPETQKALRNQSKCPRVGSNLLKIVHVGDSFAKFPKSHVLVQPMRVRNRETPDAFTDPSASDVLVENSLLEAWSGADWGWWRRLAPIGVEWWSRPRKMTIERESERVREVSTLF